MAAPVFIKEFVQDIKRPVEVRHGGGLMFTGDTLADTIKVSIVDDGAAYPVSGTVTLNCIRADGATVSVAGSVSGNVVQATLAQACCAVPGPMAAVLRITSNGVTSTVLKAVYIVDLAQTGSTIDPGTIVPSIDDLLAAIEAAESSIPADYTSLLGTIATTFSNTTAYSVGQYVWQGGKLYRFKVDHAAGTWASSEAEQVVIGNEMYAATTARKQITERIDTISGPIYYDSTTANGLTHAEIKSTDGTQVNSYHARMTGFIRVVRGDFIHYRGVAPRGYLSVAMYSDADESTYTGEWYRWYADSSAAADQHIIPIYRDGYIRVGWLAYDSSTSTDYSQYMSFGLYRTAVSRALSNAHRDWFVSAIPQGSKISIIGDGISTYKGYSSSADSAPYYPTGDFLNPSFTWWLRVINAVGGTLAVNNSYTDSQASAKTGFPSFYDRAHAGDAGNANVIFVELGSADSANSVELGDYDFSSSISSLSEATFRTAYTKGLRALQYNYSSAKIICLITEMGDDYAESIKAIASHYGVRWVDVRGYEFIASGNVHPSVYGMAQIATEALWQPDATLTLERVPAEAAAVGSKFADLSTDIGRLSSCIAVAFDSSVSYAAGDYVIRNGVLYRFTADHAAGDWIGTDAVAVNIGGQLINIKTEVGRVAGYIAGTFDTTAAYQSGDYVIRGGALWRFTSNHAAGAWTGSDAEQVTVGAELKAASQSRSRISARINTISGPIYYDPETVDNLTRAEIKSSDGTAVESYNARMSGFIRVVRGDFLHYSGVAPQGYLSIAMYSATDEATFTGEWYRWYVGSSEAADQHIIPINQNGYVRVSWLAYDSSTDTDYSSYMSFALYRTAVSRALTGAHRDWFSSPIPQGSRISVIGDSISTYAGYSDSRDPSPRYPTGDFLLPSYTWWMRIINAAGGTLAVNSSYAGSRATIQDGKPDFYDRAHAGDAGTADVILVALGTADSTSGIELGEYDFTTATIANLDETKFRSAYTKGLRALLYNYPSAKIICVILGMGDAYAESIATIAAYYNVRCVDARGYEGLSSGDVHPSIAGMAQIASAVMWQPDKTLRQNNSPADAAAVGSAFTKRDARINAVLGDVYMVSSDVDGLEHKYINTYGAAVNANYGRITQFIQVKAGDIIYYRGLSARGYFSLAMYSAADESAFTGEYYRYWATDYSPDALHVVPVILDGYVRASWWVYDNSTSTDYLGYASFGLCRGALSETFGLMRSVGNISRFFPGKFSIIGDSISTYKGISTKVSGDPSPFYPQSGLMSPMETWWMRVITASGGTLDTNNSYAGSFVTAQSAYNRPDFYDRAHLGGVGNPDVVFVALGTNDSLNSVELGNYDFTTATIANLSETTFRTAYIKGLRALMYNYPNIKVVCVAMSMSDEYAESIKTIAAHYGALFVDARGYTGIVDGNVHPNVRGMRHISAQVMHRADETLSIAGAAADAATVGAAIKALENRISALEG